MRVIGFHKSDFSFDDGRASHGMTMYLGTDITVPGGHGLRTERVYLSNEKLSGYSPKLNDEVFIERSSTGKPMGVFLVNPA